MKVDDIIEALHISIRNLVELVLRRGSINYSYTSSNRAVDGIRLHQKLQKAQKKIALLNDFEYISEFKLELDFEYKGYRFNVEGRADGIIISDNIIIEEIKTTLMPLEKIEDANLVHLVQANCYAYIYALQNKLEAININLVYCKADTEQTKTFKYTYNIDYLKKFFYDLIQKYIVFVELFQTDIRNKSINELDFPFDSYRKGQRELAIAVYKTITQQKKLFVQAPTGIGKTISTIFPAIKAMAKGYCSKIFYLASKTTTLIAAQDTFKFMKQKGLTCKAVILTAKQKICFCEHTNCNPKYCEYANGHFDRINNALIDIIKVEDILDKSIIEKYAKKHKVCPFEYSLDLALFADCIICDYNYVFDPKVCLKRFFQNNKSDYVFLIDEAHNLVDRAREMFSASLYKKDFLDIKKILKSKKFNLNNIIKLIDLDSGIVKEEEPTELYILLKELAVNIDKWLVENEGNPNYQQILDFYFKILDFFRISDFYDDRYVTFYDETGVKLFCLDPSELLKQAEQKGRTTIFFSATLTPLDYFKQVLGGESDDFFIKLQSPFEIKNLELIIIDNISTKWKNRQFSYEKIADYLYTFVNTKSGNYFAFFPSYQYMNEVYSIFIQKYDNIKTILQNNTMNECQKQDYLKEFNSDNILGFAVIGGIFSESIDLVGDKLIGAAIIGVGLPQISIERNIISEFYKNYIGKGYEFAYMYPGMNKVMQAAGRVIRTETDRGIVMLIDERFLNDEYIQLFPYEWYNYKKVYNNQQLTDCLKKFWLN